MEGKWKLYFEISQNVSTSTSLSWCKGNEDNNITISFLTAVLIYRKSCYFKMELSEVVDGHCGESYLIMRKPLLINHKEAETIKEVLYASNKYWKWKGKGDFQIFPYCHTDWYNSISPYAS